MSVARAAPKAPGYSGKPLALKLGLKPELRVRLSNAPPEYWAWCAFDPAAVTLVTARQTFDFGHVFATARTRLERDAPALAAKLDTHGMLWVSWPKKASGVMTDLSEDALRDIVLPLGLVDVKVCAVSEVWSGLKFVWRRERR